MDTAARWLSGVGEYYTADKKGAAATGTPQPAKEESKSKSQETSERGCYPGRLSGLKTKPAVQRNKRKPPAWDSGYQHGIQGATYMPGVRACLREHG